MRRHSLTLLLALPLAACSGSTDSAANHTGDSSASRTAAPVENPALGHWVGSSSECAEMKDVEFTAAGIRLAGNGGEAQTFPLIYSDVTATGVVATTADKDAKRVTIHRDDANHLTLTSPDKDKPCTLARR